jgi:hypothetical protein
MYRHHQISNHFISVLPAPTLGGHVHQTNHKRQPQTIPRTTVGVYHSAYNGATTDQFLATYAAR